MSWRGTVASLAPRIAERRGDAKKPAMHRVHAGVKSGARAGVNAALLPPRSLQIMKTFKTKEEAQAALDARARANVQTTVDTRGYAAPVSDADAEFASALQRGDALAELVRNPRRQRVRSPERCNS